VGAILFEMLTGKPPHVAPTYEAVLIAICTHDAPDVRTLAPSVPSAVAAVVERALQRDREQRFQSAQEFLTAVSALDSTFTQDRAGWATPAARAALPRQRKRYGTLVASIVASLAGFALTAYFVLRNSEPSKVSLSQEAAPLSALAAGSAASSATVAPVVSPLGSAPSVASALPARAPNAGNLRRPVAPRPSAHIASGLQLSTKEP
jgi:serine/threonine protein kinase